MADEQSFTHDAGASGTGHGLRYSPGVDGLRAVAVGAVLLYHAGISWLPGGFVGVDIFFVISGFLITSLLLAEHSRSGTLQLKNFWIRRFRRLLPALVLVTGAVMALFPALGVQWPQGTRGDAASTLFNVSNWWFLFNGESYAAAFEDPSPFQHTWSLAIEEQWYLLLPLALLLLFRGGNDERRRWLAPGFAVLALASAGLMAALAGTSQGSRLYYGTDTRLQGLLVGAALAATLATPAGRALLRKLPMALLGWLGLVGAVLFFLLADQTGLWMYRGGFLLIAVLSAVVIASVADPDVAAGPLSPGKLLGSRPFVVVGLVSYGVYLWHWPVFLVLSPERTGIDGVFLLIVRLFLTGVFATLSFIVVERPLRIGAKRNALASAQVAAPIAVLALVAALAGVFSPSISHIKPDSADSINALSDLAKKNEEGAAVPAGAGSYRLLLVGDSNTLSLFAAVRGDPGDDVTLNVATRFGCGVVPYTAAIGGEPISPTQPLCGDWAKARESEIAAAQPVTGVLFAGSWEQYDRWENGKTLAYNDPRWMQRTSAAYLRVLREIQRHAKATMVVLNHCHQVPDTGLPAATMFAAGRYPPVINAAARVDATNLALRQAVAQLGPAAGSVKIIDPNPFLCAGGYHNEQDGVTLRTDGLHLTTEGGKLLWSWLLPQLQLTN